jgi:hypothetical protein
MEKIKEVKEKHWKRLMQYPNVHSVGIGYKTTKGVKTNEVAIIVTVEKKMHPASLGSKYMIPSALGDVKTDVVEAPMNSVFEYTEKERPAPGGVSIGHKDITAGTLGCLVWQDTGRFILSNNHVLANSNQGEIDDPILQPGPYDGGKYPTDAIATLWEYVPIEFSTFPPPPPPDDPCSIASVLADVLNWLSKFFGRKSRLIVTQDEIDPIPNYVDAAIALPMQEDWVVNEIKDIGEINGVGDSYLGMKVKKTGRTTEYTESIVKQIDVSTIVSYGTNKVALFVDQIMAGPLSQPGDSGSAVLDENNYLVGLLFAGSDTNTLYNRIENVFDALDLNL